MNAKRVLAFMAIIAAFLLLFYSPKIVTSLYLWNASVTDFFADQAYNLALNMGAEGLRKDGSIFTLQNGEEVIVAFTCVDIVVLAFNTLIPYAIFTVVLYLYEVYMTLPQMIILFLIMLTSSIVANIIRIATTVYLANNYYDTLVKPVGWISFHDSIGLAVMLIHALVWLIIALAIAA